MAKFFLRKKAGNRIVSGHPWVFANEIGDTDGNYSAGDIVELFSYSGSFIGRGFVNPASQIRIRLLTWQKDELIDDSFFVKKLRRAWAYRQKIGFSENCRLVHGEADGLPGLIIDKYNEYLVVQSQALGIDKWMHVITSTLEDIFKPKGIYLRNDTPIRLLEGLSQEQQYISKSFDTNIKIKENDLSIHIDIANGLKTGYQLDHSINRTLLQHFVKDAEVLDVFCYSGSFALHAAKYGAKKVVGLDIDETAITLAKQNAASNNYEQVCSFEIANAFDILKAWGKDGKLFDVVILDPPSFSSNKTNIEKALIGYKEINLRAMKLLRQGGFLVTTSSTHTVSIEQFKEVLEAAAKDAGRLLKQYSYQTQSPDHPIVWNIPTTKHLDFFILQVV